MTKFLALRPLWMPVEFVRETTPLASSSKAGTLCNTGLTVKLCLSLLIVCLNMLGGVH